ncbi:MAG: hypothetical protein EOP53_18760 [Sphingobacteriales bacterium]|nr:MAG: hypothetical protein EOP53_18760 [Sphingobacteriales bacterium]
MLHAQNDSAKAPKNNVYLELGGRGQFYSVNYERRIYKIKNVKGALALGGAKHNALGGWYTGLEHNVFIGNGIHNFEIGAGYNQLFFTNPDNTSEDHYINGRIGYRLQPLEKGLMVRMGYTPFFRPKQTVLHWVGLSFGYSF